MAAPTRRLGRGLTSLLATPMSTSRPESLQVPEQREATNDQEPGNLVQRLELKSIIPNKSQPRKQFDAASLERLAESIRSAGVMQPILVRASDEAGQYEIVAGERRFRAAGLAGLGNIPAIVVDIGDEESAEWALIENMQRDDLAPMEKAWALKALTDRFGLTHAQIAEKVGLDRSSVTNMIRLSELEPEIIALLDQRKLSFGHGKALLTCPPGERRVELARHAVEDEWSVRRLERAGATVAATADRVGKTPGRGASARPERKLEHEAGIRNLEQQLSEHLGTKVELAVGSKGDKGRVIISFYGLDHFDSLMAKMGYRPK